MKDAIKIVFMLTLVVVVASISVFFVESVTTPIIEDREAKEIEEALQTVYPAIVGSGYDTFSDVELGLDLTGSGAIGATVIKDGDTIKAVLYTVQFTGYNAGNKYIVGVDFEGKITGFQVLNAADSAGYGVKLGEPERWEQFTGKLLEVAAQGDFDGIVGATFTTNGWIESFNVLYAYHKDNFPVVELTNEQKAVESMKDIAPEGATFTKYTAFDEDPSENDIVAAYMVNDGTEDVAIIYYSEFVGYNTGDFNSIIVSVNLTTNLVDGYKVLRASDSEDYGYKITDEDKQTQFIDKTMDNLAKSEFDGIVGASTTTLAWEDAVAAIGVYHNSEFLGIKTYTFAEQFKIYQEELITDGINFNDVTVIKPANPFVTQVFDVTDASDTTVGTVYYVTTIGSSVSPLSIIQFLVGVDISGNFTGLRMVADTENVSGVDMETLFYNTTFGDSIKGEALDSDFSIESAEGETTTAFKNIQVALENIADYHIEKYYQRPDSIEASVDDLKLAYPSADHFVSIYEDYDYQVGIGNVYEAQDTEDAVIGYVYIGYFKGNGNEAITFAWGVNNAGLSEQMNIITGVQSWDQATEPYNPVPYDGSEGTDFATSSWLENFEGVLFTSLQTTPVDEVTGVSETTGPMTSVVDTIVNFHIDNSVGGGL